MNNILTLKMLLTFLGHNRALFHLTQSVNSGQPVFWLTDKNYFRILFSENYFCALFTDCGRWNTISYAPRKEHLHSRISQIKQK